MIYIASDHRGIELKSAIIDYIKKRFDRDIEDCGPFSSDSVDYPDYAHRVCQKLVNSPHSQGILICYTANGMTMTSNKYPEIRAGLTWTPKIAEMIRKHNDANVMCLPAGFVSNEDALECVDNFLMTFFEGGRHLVRVQKMNCMKPS